MTKQEALDILAKTIIQDKPSVVNKVLSHAEMFDIIKRGITSMADGQIHEIFEKRVWQVYKNQIRPIQKAD